MAVGRIAKRNPKDIDAPPRGRGRPRSERKEINEKVLKALIAFTDADIKKICSWMGVSEKVIRRDYADILEERKHDRNENVEFSLFYNATVNNNVAAQIFWLKNNMPEKYGEIKEDTVIDKQELLADIAKALPK